MNRPEVFVVSAVSNAIGTYGGTLRVTPPMEFATQLAVQPFRAPIAIRKRWSM